MMYSQTFLCINDLRLQCDLAMSVHAIQVLNLTLCVSAKLLCGLEASQGAVEEVLSSSVSVTADALDSSDDLDPEDDGENETQVTHKKKNKRRKGIICNLFKVCTSSSESKMESTFCATLPGC